jgi:tetratricopeptide (TPR) repeat protein
LGEAHLARGQYEAARDELILALRINAEEPRAQIALGRTWLAIGRAQDNDPGVLAKARKVLEGARGVPEGARLQTLGQVSLAEGDPTAAIELFERGLEEGAKPLPTRLALVEARMAARDLEGVTQELERAQEIAPTDTSISLSLGLIYLRRGNQERAAEEFLEAIQNAGVTVARTSDAAEGTLMTVVMPSPHVPLPRRLDLNGAIRRAYRGALAKNGKDPNAKALQEIAQSMSFVL